MDPPEQASQQLRTPAELLLLFGVADPVLAAIHPIKRGNAVYEDQRQGGP